MRIVQPKVRYITELDGEKMLLLIQQIAKNCYQTRKITDDIDSAKRIVKSLIQSGHHSMLEFVNIIVEIDTNISGYKDCRTHRHSTWAVESSRFCNYSKGRFGEEISFLDPIEFPDKNSELYKKWKETMLLIEKNYIEMAKLGATPDQLSLLLPQSTKGTAVVSANLREWRHILSLRSSVAATGHARPSIVSLMDEILETFHSKIPIVFDDLYEQMKINQMKKQHNLINKQVINTKEKTK